MTLHELNAQTFAEAPIYANIIPAKPDSSPNYYALCCRKQNSTNVVFITYDDNLKLLTQLTTSVENVMEDYGGLHHLLTSQGGWLHESKTECWHS